MDLLYLFVVLLVDLNALLGLAFNVADGLAHDLVEEGGSLLRSGSFLCLRWSWLWFCLGFWGLFFFILLFFRFCV